MRFQYIDDKGKKVDLQSVEALAARISLGAVHDDMELYDAVADRWAPAAEHEIYQQLRLEAGGGSATISPLIGASHADHEETPVDAPGAQTDSESAEASAAEPEVEAESDPAADPPAETADDGDASEAGAPEPAEKDDDFDILSGGGDLGLTLVEGVEGSADAAPEETAAKESASDGDDGGFDLGLDGMELALEGSDEEEADEAGDLGGGSDDLTLTNETPGGERLDLAEAAPDSDAVDGLVPAGDYGMGDGDSFESPPEAAPDGFAMEGFETGVGSVEGFESGPADAESFEMESEPPTGQAGWAAPNGADDEDGDEFITDRDPFSAPRGEDEEPAEEDLERVHSEAEARKEAARTKAEERMRDSAPAAAKAQSGGPMRLILVVAVGAVVVGGGTLLALRQFSPTTVASGPQAEAPVEPEVVLPAAPDLDATQAEALAGAVNTGAVASLALLDSLRASAELADGPPQGWLQGRYLAQASTFPEVDAYFSRATDLWRGNMTTLAERFRDAAMASMMAGGMAETDARSLLERSGRWTIPVEMDLEAVSESSLSGAESALDLHAYLVSVEDRIEYDPFDQPGVPADPVVEAIPQDPEVEAEMWDRIGEVADAFRDTELLLQGFDDRAAARADSIRGSAGG